MTQTAPEMWRTGRSVGRTIYRMVGPVASKDDVLIGVMDTPQLAVRVVAAVNAASAALAKWEADRQAAMDASESPVSGRSVPSGSPAVPGETTEAQEGSDG